MQDCWDNDKLARMNFKQTAGNCMRLAVDLEVAAIHVPIYTIYILPAEARDPGLNQFSKMVKCLEMQGGGGAGKNASIST